MQGQTEPRLIAPAEGDFAKSAAWSLTIPAQSMDGLSDVYVRIGYAGDIARLYEGKKLLDDNFYDGAPWEIGLKRFSSGALEHKLEVEVLPMPKNDLIYLDTASWKKLGLKSQTARVDQIAIIPEYDVVMAVE